MARRSLLVAKSEAELWEAQKAVADGALTFAIEFLGCRMGQNNTALTPAARARLFTMVRAMSVVESRHGTAGKNQPAHDPLQSGNPGDAWWMELTGQSGQGSRFVRGPGLKGLWANEINAAAEKTAGFPNAASFTKLTDPKQGHKDAGFTPTHSYVWGLLYFIHRMNTGANDKTYECGDLSRDRLIDGAVAYNGGGDPKYRKKIEDALIEIGEPLPDKVEPFLQEFARAETPPSSEAVALLSGLIAAASQARPVGPVKRLELQFAPETGRVTAIAVEFGDPS